MRLPVLHRGTNHFQITLYAERMHLVTQLSQRGDDVVLRLPGRSLEILAVELVWRNEVFMHQHEYA